MRRLAPRDDGEPSRREAAFRRTPRQALGRGVTWGAGAGLAVVGFAAAGLFDRWVEGQHGPRCAGWWLLGAFGVPVALGALIGSVLGVRSGVDAYDVGLRTVPASRGFAAWADIVDLRAERRRSRTVVAVYLGSGRVVRLRAPYDGGLLERDPDFERKFFTLENLWETHRNWRSPA